MKQLVTALSSLVFLLFGASTALSGGVQTGTPAWSIQPLILMEGPGYDYNVVGGIEGQVRIYVDRCSREWCRVHSGHEAGWTSLYAIAFGNVARGPLTGPRLNYKSNGPGLVCLYEGRNFTGASMCARAGTILKDLMLLGADNLFSSVTIEGNVSVDLCRDRGFHSYCERINDSEPRLHGFLDNHVSAVRVY